VLEEVGEVEGGAPAAAEATAGLVVGCGCWLEVREGGCCWGRGVGWDLASWDLPCNALL
jgi:hypothetical protein